MKTSYRWGHLSFEFKVAVQILRTWKSMHTRGLCKSSSRLSKRASFFFQILTWKLLGRLVFDLSGIAISTIYGESILVDNGFSDIPILKGLFHPEKSFKRHRVFFERKFSTETELCGNTCSGTVAFIDVRYCVQLWIFFSSVERYCVWRKTYYTMQNTSRSPRDFAH